MDVRDSIELRRDDSDNYGFDNTSPNKQQQHLHHHHHHHHHRRHHSTDNLLTSPPPLSLAHSHYAVLHVRTGASTAVTQTSSPLLLTPRGIAIGTRSAAAFYCNRDPLVASHHGTLERTLRHGIWIYVDHSHSGTMLNARQCIHHSAAIVTSGDRLVVGNTEIEVALDVATESQRIRSDSAIQRPQIATSFNENVINTEPAATTLLEYSASPVPTARRKRLSIVRTPPPPTATSPLLHYENQKLRAKRPVAPPPTTERRQPRMDDSAMHRMRRQHTNNQNEQSDGEAMATSPVLVPQSASPRVMPQQPLSRNQNQIPQHAGSEPPKSQRDNLRIQLLLKTLDQFQHQTQNQKQQTAGNVNDRLRVKPTGLAIPSSSFTPAASHKHHKSQRCALEYTPPSSPVAQKDILQQQATLLTILKDKVQQEQLLKQQQEAWLRTQMTTLNPNPNQTSNQTSNSNQISTSNDDASAFELPLRAPALLRTISLGLHQASPRLTAAVLASRARMRSSSSGGGHSPSLSNASSTESQQHYQQQVFEAPTAHERLTTTDLDDGDTDRVMDDDDEDDCVSVSSSVTTIRTTHRRILRSLSRSGSAASDADSDDINERSAAAGVVEGNSNDFCGYDNDDDAVVASPFFPTDPPPQQPHAPLPPVSFNQSLGQTVGRPTRRRGSQLFSTYYNTPPTSNDAPTVSLSPPATAGIEPAHDALADTKALRSPFRLETTALRRPSFATATRFAAMPLALTTDRNDDDDDDVETAQTTSELLVHPNASASKVKATRRKSASPSSTQRFRQPTALSPT